MKYFNGVIVVEGTGDSSYLSSFICAEYVVLNGYDMPEDVVDYLKHIKNRKILVMTDPDDAGFSIEKRLKETGLNKWKPTPVFLPGESHGQRSLAGYSP